MKGVSRQIEKLSQNRIGGREKVRKGGRGKSEREKVRGRVAYHLVSNISLPLQLQ